MYWESCSLSVLRFDTKRIVQQSFQRLCWWIIAPMLLITSTWIWHSDDLTCWTYSVILKARLRVSCLVLFLLEKLQSWNQKMMSSSKETVITTLLQSFGENCIWFASAPVSFSFFPKLFAWINKPICIIFLKKPSNLFCIWHRYHLLVPTGWRNVNQRVAHHCCTGLNAAAYLFWCSVLMPLC